MGLVAPQHVESSRIRDWTRVPCIGRWILNHCATREVPLYIFVIDTLGVIFAFFHQYADDSIFFFFFLAVSMSLYFLSTSNSARTTQHLIIFPHSCPTSLLLFLYFLFEWKGLLSTSCLISEIQDYLDPSLHTCLTCSFFIAILAVFCLSLLSHPIAQLLIFY